MTKSQYPTIIEKSLQSNESHLYQVDIRGIFPLGEIVNIAQPILQSPRLARGPTPGASR